jgi:teichuronic acid biosynthesis glycosyltransferase TuaG
MCLISILMPIYNGYEYLDESLLSVINQTYKNWELIIGINGHKPDSDIILKIKDTVNNLINNFHNDNLKNQIKIIIYDTKGKPATLNKMINNANGDYIAILDVDDYWLSEKLEKQIPYLYNYDVIGTNCRYFGKYSHCPNIPFGDLTNYDFIINGNPIINSSSLIRKELAIWNENERFDDYELWLELSLNKKKFYNISDILCMHRIYNNSSFNSDVEFNKQYYVTFIEKWKNKYYK